MNDKEVSGSVSAKAIEAVTNPASLGGSVVGEEGQVNKKTATRF
jgi:hypothetical protein